MTEAITTPTYHSTTVGGSTAKRIINCPGSYALSNRVPKQPSSTFAAEGTALHNAIEWCITAEADGDDADDVIGRKFAMGDGEELEITRDHWNECLEPCMQAFDQVVGDGDFILEHSAPFPGIENAFGTADVVYVTKRNGVTVGGILDWKFGRGVPVAAEGNDQLYFYLHSCLSDKSIDPMFKDVDALEVTVVQPRLMDGPDIAKVLVLDLLAWSKRLIIAWDLAKTEQAPFEEGSHCKFCRGKPLCPIKTGLVRKAQLMDPADLNTLSEAMQMVAKLEDWSRDVQKLVHDQLEQGQAVEGYKLVDKRATRQWVDEEVTEAWMRKHNVLVGTMMVPKKLRSVTQLEKALKGLKQKIPEGQVHKVSSGTTVATEDDKRPSVDRTFTGLAEVVKSIS